MSPLTDAEKVTAVSVSGELLLARRLTIEAATAGFTTTTEAVVTSFDFPLRFEAVAVTVYVPASGKEWVVEEPLDVLLSPQFQEISTGTFAF